MATKPAPTQSGAGARHIETFLEMLAAERGVSPRTLSAYQADLNDFADFLHGRRTAVGEADSALIRKYMAKLGRAGLAPATAARRLSAIRQFHRFLYAEGVRGDDPARAIEGPRRDRPLPKW